MTTEHLSDLNDENMAPFSVASTDELAINEVMENAESRNERSKSLPDSANSQQQRWVGTAFMDSDDEE